MLKTLLGCAQQSAEFDFELIYGEDGDDFIVQDLINSGVTARVIFSYEGLQGGTRIEPVEASPPRCDGCDPGQAEVTEIGWEKASNPGFSVNEDPNLPPKEKIRVKGVPLNQRDLRVGIEFLKPITAPVDPGNPDSLSLTEEFVVVRGCLRPFDTNEPITKDRLQSRMSEGIRLFAGRSCGTCPPSESEAFDQDTGAPINMEQFTVADIEGGFLPPPCQEL